MTEGDANQDFTYEYIFCILIPASLSLAVSTIIVINFLLISTHFQSFIYHQISAFFAFCDIVSHVGVILGAPNLFNTKHCMLRENLFLCGSYMKVLAVAFNTCLIYYVIAYSAVPSMKSVRTVVLLWLLLSGICIFCIIYYRAAQVLCYDPVAGSFSPDDVSATELRAFSWAYFFPISLSFFAVVTLLIMTYRRLQTTFNSAMLFLVQRLIPYPLIFCFSYVPIFLFQLINFLAGGRRVFFFKRLGLFGMSVSGAAFGICYIYIHMKGVRTNSESSQLRTGVTSDGSDRPNLRRELSWTNSSLGNSGATVSDREVSTTRDDTFVTFFPRRTSLSGQHPIFRISEGSSNDTSSISSHKL